jgi:hypothetical protein
MKNLFSRHNLVLLLVLLAGSRFVLVPFLQWQSEIITDIRGKAQHLNKLQALIENQGKFKAIQDQLNSTIKQTREDFFVSDESTKLRIQRQVEDVLSTHEVNMDRFRWVFDQKSASVRTLRASIRYEGETAAIIKVFWNLTRLPQIVRQVDWKQRIKAQRDSLGRSSGEITLEFYAVEA